MEKGTRINAITGEIEQFDVETTIEIIETVETLENIEVTQRQLRLELLNRGITAEMIDGVIDNLPEPEKTQAKIEFEFASYFERQHPLINQLGEIFAFSPSDLDEIFINAKNR